MELAWCTDGDMAGHSGSQSTEDSVIALWECTDTTRAEDEDKVCFAGSTG